MGAFIAMLERGVGHKTVGRLWAYVQAVVAPCGMVGSMTAGDKAAFYAQHGFTHRPDGLLGAGMTLVL